MKYIDQIPPGDRAESIATVDGRSITPATIELHADGSVTVDETQPITPIDGPGITQMFDDDGNLALQVVDHVVREQS